MEGPNCPVKALVRRFLHLRDEKGEKNKFICSYWDNGTECQVRDEDIRVNVKRDIVYLGLQKHGSTSNRLGSHYLRVGRYITLNFSGADRYDIKKMGRWSLDKFLIYIQDQIE